MTEDRARPVLWRGAFASLLILNVGILAYMSFMVVPKMESLFGAVAVDLPVITEMAFRVAMTVRSFWWLLVAGTVALLAFGLSGSMDPVVKGVSLVFIASLLLLTGVTLLLHVQLHSMIEALSS